MNYPLISEYIEAIKAAKDNFEQLSYLRPVLDDDGLPVMTSGNFAVVFKMKDERDEKLFAVKCFTKEQEGREEAYHQITEELKNVSSPYLTSVRYLDKELFVDTDQTNETEFPVLLMDWVEGMTLDKYLFEICTSMMRYHKDQWKYMSGKYALQSLAFSFEKLGTWLKLQSFAHGDLKPDNILVQKNKSLVLVDYDGMYVPSMKGQRSRELGSLDFRHPQRTDKDFDENIDNFPIASILLSLEAIAYDADYFVNYGAPDRLLFSAHNYRNITRCELIKKLLDVDDKRLSKATRLFIEELLRVSDFLPLNGLEIPKVYGYKQNGNLVVCDTNFSNIGDKVSGVFGNTIYQYESEYNLNSFEINKHITLSLNEQGKISIKLSEDTIFAIPRLFIPFKYNRVDILIKGDIIEHLIGDNYIKQDYLILNGKRYNHIKYLLTLKNYHLLGKLDVNGNVKEYYLIGPNEKVIFYTKIKDSFIFMTSQYGSFELIGQNEKEIWYFNDTQGLKKYKKDERIDLTKAHVHKDQYAYLIVTNHSIYLNNRPFQKEFELVGKYQANWIVAIYRTKPPKSEGYKGISLEYDLKQVVLPGSLFCGYQYGFLKYKNGNSPEPYYSLYDSKGFCIGLSELGNIFKTHLPVARKYDYNTGTDMRAGLFDLSQNKQIVPNNFNDIDYRIVENNMISIVMILHNEKRLYGVFLNDNIIIPIQEYDEIKFNVWTNRFICVQENEDTDVKKLYKWDGTFITNYQYAVAPLRYYDSWQQECYSNSVFKVFDKDFDREYKDEEEEFRLCINDKMVSKCYFKSISWCQTVEDWQSDVHDILRCVGSNGKRGLFHVGLNKWVAPIEYDSIEFDRLFGIPVIILDGKILLNNNYEEVYIGEDINIINYSWIYVIKDNALNKYVFYNPFKGEIIEDLKQNDGIISSKYFKFSIADEKYLWLKDLKFEPNGECYSNNSDQ